LRSNSFPNPTRGNRLFGQRLRRWFSVWSKGSPRRIAGRARPAPQLRHPRRGKGIERSYRRAPSVHPGEAELGPGPGYLAHFVRSRTGIPSAIYGSDAISGMPATCATRAARASQGLDAPGRIPKQLQDLDRAFGLQLASYIMGSPMLAAEIETFLAATQMTVGAAQTGTTLVIPGHRPFSWAPRRRRYRFPPKRRPLFHEESATLLLSFLIKRFALKVFFDIGASNGYFSRVAASHLATPTVNAGVIFPRQAGVIFPHSRQQEGPRARGPSCCLASFFRGPAVSWRRRQSLPCGLGVWIG
jgi:hypothetical protein